MPPRTLTDAQLAESLRSLRAKLHSSRRTLVFAYIAGTTVSLVLISIGLILLWYGPQSFLDRILGLRQSNSVTTMLMWWIAVVSVAAFGGAMGIQVLSGKLRYARHWKHRVEELELRLQDVETEQERRVPGSVPPRR